LVVQDIKTFYNMLCFYHSRTSPEKSKPARSCKDSSAEPNDFNTTLLQQLKPIPIYPTNPSLSERSSYSQSPPANQDPNVQQVFLNPILKQGPPKSSIQVKKPEIIHHFGTKRPLKVKLPPALQSGFQAPPMPGASTASQQALGTQLLQPGFQAPPMPGASTASQQALGTQHLQPGFQAQPIPGVPLTSQQVFGTQYLQTGFQAPPMPGVSITSQQVFGNQPLPPGFQAPPMPGVPLTSQQVHFSWLPSQLGFQAPPMPGAFTSSQQALGTQLLPPGFQAPAMHGAYTSSQQVLFTQPPPQLGFYQAPPIPGVSTAFQQVLGTQLMQPGFKASPMPGPSTLVALAEGISD